MTTIATPIQSKAKAAAPDPKKVLLSPAVLVPLAVMAIAFVAVFWRWLLKQYQPHLPGVSWSFLEPLGGYSWQKPEDWGHAYMVPLISLFEIYRRRDAFVSAVRTSFWPALAVVVMGVVMYVFFIIGFSNHMFQGVALVLTLAGLCLLTLGPKLFGFLVFPLLYLLFAVTISESVMNTVTYRLQDIAAQGAWVTLNMIGIDTDLTGNVLTPHDSTGKAIEPLNVAEACSGMRMVIAFLALSVAVGWFGCRYWWQRAALFMLGVPTAVFMNVIRVTVLGIAALYNPDLSTGASHMFIGNILLFVAFFLFMGVVWTLKRIQPDPAPAAVKPKASVKGVKA